MTKRGALSAAAIESLRELGRISAGRPYAAEHALLAHCGLIDINTGRFGAYARITEAGRQHLARTASQQVVGPPAKRVAPAIRGVPNPCPEATAGSPRKPASATKDTSLRGAAPRPSRIAAKQAIPHGQKRR